MAFAQRRYLVTGTAQESHRTLGIMAAKDGATDQAVVTFFQLTLGEVVRAGTHTGTQGTRRFHLWASQSHYPGGVDLAFGE